MKQSSFDAKILELWTTTRLPLTRVNVVAVTGVPLKRAEGWLDAMVRSELLDMDSNDDGELLWTARGSTRPARGLETVAEVTRMASLRAEVAAPSRKNDAPVVFRAREKKSALLSTALSFFLGPIGLLYAAPMRVALPAGLAWLLAGAIVPSFLLVYIAGLVCPISAIAGLLYAWGYNRAGARVPLLGDGPRPLKLLGR